MRRPCPTRIRAGSASDRTFNRPHTNKRPRQTNPTDAEVLSHQLSVIRPVPSTSLGSPAFRTRQRRKYPCETNPKLRDSFRLRRISSQTSDARHQSRERQRPDLQSPAHQQAPAPNEAKPRESRRLSVTGGSATCRLYRPAHPAATRRPSVLAASQPARQPGAKRTQAPRPSESPRSRPPPTCLRASVPSCLPSYQTNPNPSTSPSSAGPQLPWPGSRPAAGPDDSGETVSGAAAGQARTHSQHSPES